MALILLLPLTDKILRTARLVVQFGGEPHQGWLPAAAPEPAPTPSLRIATAFAIRGLGPAGYSLSWHPAEGGSYAGPPYEGDTWHASLEEALEHAYNDFGLTQKDWVSV